ncbi:MAG: hypothetical protein ACOYT8_02380 [Candidatus Dependentiae bacterium]
MKLVRIAALAALTASLAQATTQLDFALKLNEEVLAKDTVIVSSENSVAVGTTTGLTVVVNVVEETEEAVTLKFDVVQDDKVVCTPEAVVTFGADQATITCQGPVNYELTLSAQKVVEVAQSEEAVVDPVETEVAE